MAEIFVTKRDGSLHRLDEPATGQPLMEVLRDNDMDVEALCGGCCSCATCHVFIDPEWMAKLAERSEDERDLVSETESYDEGRSRLSCQIPFTDELTGLKLTVAPAD